MHPAKEAGNPWNFRVCYQDWKPNYSLNGVLSLIRGGMDGFFTTFSCGIMNAWALWMMMEIHNGWPRPDQREGMEVRRAIGESVQISIEIHSAKTLSLFVEDYKDCKEEETSLAIRAHGSFNLTYPDMIEYVFPIMNIKHSCWSTQFH